MKLLLTSSLSDVPNIVKDLPMLQDVQSISFISTASIVEDYKGYVDAARDVFTANDIKLNELEVSSASINEIEDKLNNSDAIYICGGNTFFLIQELKKKGADQIIINLVKDGKIYIGESAGSVICAQDVEYVSGMDDKSIAKDLVSTSALNLINFSVLPHYGDEPFAESSIATYEKYKDELELVKITNSQAILIEGNNISILNN